MCCPTAVMLASCQQDLQSDSIPATFDTSRVCLAARSMYMPAWWAQQAWHRLDGRAASCRTVSCLVADLEVRDAADIIRATRDSRRSCKCEIKGGT